jgi:hypothetical protein
VASGRAGQRDEAAIRIKQKDATLHAARLAPGASVALPTAPFAHLYVPIGSVVLEDAGELREGDAARIEGAEGQRVTAGASGAEILVWEMHADLR